MVYGGWGAFTLEVNSTMLENGFWRETELKIEKAGGLLIDAGFSPNAGNSERRHRHPAMLMAARDRTVIVKWKRHGRGGRRLGHVN